MNRKEGIVMVAVLLSTFIGGVFAAQNVPAIQQVFVTNFPKNQNVTVTNLSKGPTPSILYVLRNATITVAANTYLSLGNISTVGFREVDAHFHFLSAIAPYATNPIVDTIVLYALPAPDSSFPGLGSWPTLNAGTFTIDNLYQGGGQAFVQAPPYLSADFDTQVRILVTAGELRIWLPNVPNIYGQRGPITIYGLTIALYLNP